MAERVMLASPVADLDWSQEWLASIKIDGIRAYLDKNMKLTSRNGKPIRNKFISTLLEMSPEYRYCDGELLTFTNGKRDDFNTVQSKVMTERGSPDFQWLIFDKFQYTERPYFARIGAVPEGIHPRIKIVSQIPVASQEKLDRLEMLALKDGWEGLIVRRNDAPYKFGRSTLREGYLLKLVRKNRAEAVIVGAQERMHNANEATVNNLGYTTRTGHKANLVGRDDLGSFEVEWDGVCDGRLFDGLEEGDLPIKFNVGTGFDDGQRAEYWAQANDMIKHGQRIVFEFRGIGTEKRPRFPAFIGMYND